MREEGGEHAPIFVVGYGEIPAGRHPAIGPGDSIEVGKCGQSEDRQQQQAEVEGALAGFAREIGFLEHGFRFHEGMMAPVSPGARLNCKNIFYRILSLTYRRFLDGASRRDAGSTKEIYLLRAFRQFPATPERVGADSA
jgi:hypothetical protein